MAKLQTALQKPHEASRFIGSGNGPASIAQQLALPGDFSGCYVLVDKSKPIYVGISRKVLTRLRQHLIGTSHMDTSLVYSMAQHRRPTIGKRSEAMKKSDFIEAFSASQAYLRSLHIAFIAIENPLELYLFEVYAAMTLNTDEWNSFRTH